MNLSIITTALPSLGRLIIELQPSVFSYTIKDDPTDPRSPNAQYTFSTMGQSRSLDTRAEDMSFPGTSAQVTSGWREGSKEDTESTDGLVGDAVRQNVIQQTIHFEVRSAVG